MKEKEKGGLRRLYKVHPELGAVCLEAKPPVPVMDILPLLRVATRANKLIATYLLGCSKYRTNQLTADAVLAELFRHLKVLKETIGARMEIVVDEVQVRPPYFSPAAAHTHAVHTTLLLNNSHWHTTLCFLL